MPYIQITSVYGHCREIHSSDNETVGRWLVETLALFTSPNEAYAEIHIRVRPLPVGIPPNDAWDWHPASNREFAATLKELTPLGNVRALARAMEHYADECEEEKNRG